MRFSEQIKSISYLKANAAEVLDQLAETREPLIITQNGEAKAVHPGHQILRRNAGNSRPS